jgi:hypothetical protein
MSSPRVRERIPAANFRQRTLGKVQALGQLGELFSHLIELFRQTRHHLLGAWVTHPYTRALPDGIRRR